MKLLRMLICISSVVCTGVSDYQLRVRVHSYLNPDSRCAVCTRSLSDPVYGCCDNPTNTGVCRGSERCDTFFRYCLRPQGSMGVECPINDQTGINTARFSPDTDVLLNVGDTVLGSPNPLTLSGPTWRGFQFYLEAKDSDRPDGGGVKDIDSFAVDLPIEGGQGVEQTLYEGLFEIAEIELSFELVCTDNYSLPDCTTCQPGSTHLCMDRRMITGDMPSAGDGSLVGGVTGGVVGALAIAVIIVILLLVTYKCLSKRKNGTPTHSTIRPPTKISPMLGDNPVYGAQETRSDQSSSPANTLSISVGLEVGESGVMVDEEREFDNPLYSDSVSRASGRSGSYHRYSDLEDSAAALYEHIAS